MNHQRFAYYDEIIPTYVGMNRRAEYAKPPARHVSPTRVGMNRAPLLSAFRTHSVSPTHVGMNRL